MCNGAAKQVSADIAPWNIKCQNLFGNVETGLKMLLPDSHKIGRYQFHALGRERVVSDWLTQHSVTRPNECYTVELLFFSPLRPLRAVAKEESGSTFCETCLAVEV